MLDETGIDLGHHDSLKILSLIRSCISCSDENDLLEVMGQLGNLLPSDGPASALLLAESQLVSSCMLNINYSDEYRSVRYEGDNALKNSKAKTHIEALSWDFWSATTVSECMANTAIQVIPLPADFEMESLRGGTGFLYRRHGRLDWEGTVLGYSKIARNCRTDQILAMVLPHFHEAFYQIGMQPRYNMPLSDKELTVLHWLGEGKSSWDTACILGISERTVKFHVSNIMKKMDAVNRTHAVAKALVLGLIGTGRQSATIARRYR